MTPTILTLPDAPDIPKPASLKLPPPTQISINAEKAFLRLSPHFIERTLKVKLATTKFLQEKFELPDAQLIPGIRSQTGCPIAKALRSANLQEVKVKRTRVLYKDSSGLLTRVMLPAKVREFIRLFDAGFLPELNEQP